MRLGTRISNLERKVRPNGPTMLVVESEDELKKLLKEHPEAKFKTILVVEPVNKPANSGL